VTTPMPILAHQYEITWTTIQPHMATVSATRLAELLCVDVEDLDPDNLTDGPEISLVDAIAEIEDASTALAASEDMRREDLTVTPVRYRHRPRRIS
jgi:hypothetical protein